MGMKFTKTRGMQALLVATVTAMVVMPVAIAGANGHSAARRAPRGIAKQVKALKKQSAAMAKQLAEFSGQNAALAAKVAALSGQNAALEGKVTTLSGQNAALGGKVTALEARQAPTSLPPSGPAGGDLTGSYPNPTLGPNTVGSANVKDGSIQSADILDGTIGSADILDNSIGSADILDGTIGTNDILDGTIRQSDLGAQSVNAPALALTSVQGPPLGKIIHAGESGFSSVTCPPGSRLLGGGWNWEHTEPAEFHNVRVEFSRPSSIDPAHTWQVEASVLSGPNNSLIAEAICLG
jgi:hypothetical protein